MSFVDKLKSRKNDVQALSSLMESSIDHAAASGSTLAGAHHLAIAAFDMSDTTAEDALALPRGLADQADHLVDRCITIEVDGGVLNRSDSHSLILRTR